MCARATVCRPDAAISSRASRPSESKSERLVYIAEPQAIRKQKLNRDAVSDATASILTWLLRVSKRRCPLLALLLLHHHRACVSHSSDAVSLAGCVRCVNAVCNCVYVCYDDVDDLPTPSPLTDFFDCSESQCDVEPPNLGVYCSRVSFRRSKQNNRKQLTTRQMPSSA